MRRALILAAAAALAACDDDGTAPGEHPAAPPRVADGGPTPVHVGVRPTRLHLRVVDAATRAPIPAMVSLFPAGGRDRLRFGRWQDEGTAGMGADAVEAGIGGALVTYHGLAVWRGEAIVPVGMDLGVKDGDRAIAYGRYRLVANRGLEYELAEATVDLQRDRGDVLVELPLARVVDTSGYLAADMHVHSAAPMQDANLREPDRIKSMVVAGIEVVVGSNHDHNTDLAGAIRSLWLPEETAPIAAVAGNETSLPDAGHFNVFPVLADPALPARGALRFAAPLPTSAFFERLRSLPGPPIVQLNHGRLGPGNPAYFDRPACGPWRDRDLLPPCALDFQVMEVLSGYLTCGTKIDEQLADWYALLRFGVVVTAAGNSDSHGTSRLLGGFPRTYVRVPDDRPEAFRQDEFVAALRGHRAVATSGPFLTLRVNESSEEGAIVHRSDGTFTVKIRMQAASWVWVDEVRLKVDGRVAKTWAVPAVGGATPLLEVTESVRVEADAFLTAEASGRRALPAFVVGDWTEAPDGGGIACRAHAGAEQGMAVFAVTNPVFVDADGDGRFRGPRQPEKFPVPTR